MSAAAMPVEFTELKSRLRRTWMAGDYDRFSRYMEGGARLFYDSLNIPPGSHLLDVGCGSGQLALMAAREGVRVTGIDIAENLVERARARAEAEELTAQFEVADAEDVPFPDATFDVVTSLIGAMFAPRPDLVAKELLRVCVPGGTVAMANWTPAGFIGQMFKTIARFIAPAGMPSPVLWGDEDTVRQRLAAGVCSLELQRRTYPMSYPFPPADVVEFFRLHYGPMDRAFSTLDAGAQAELRSALEQLWSRHNRARDGFTHVDAEYLAVIGTRR